MLYNLITQRKTIKVIHWLFFSCRVNSFKKYRQPGIMRRMWVRKINNHRIRSGIRQGWLVNHRISRDSCAVPAAVLWVALSNSLLKLHIKKCQLLPALLLQNFVKDGCIEIIHRIPSLQQEVVSHGLQVPKKPKIKMSGLRINALQSNIVKFTHTGFNLTCSLFSGFSWGSHSIRCISSQYVDTNRSGA